MAKWNALFEDDEVAAYISEDGARILCLERHYVNHNMSGQPNYSRVWKMYDANNCGVIVPEMLKHEPHISRKISVNPS